MAGSGAWADKESACSTTGHGEGITRCLLAKRICDFADNSNPTIACQKGLNFMLKKYVVLNNF